jgi:hypothetical protein
MLLTSCRRFRSGAISTAAAAANANANANAAKKNNNNIILLHSPLSSSLLFKNVNIKIYTSL